MKLRIIHVYVTVVCCLSVLALSMLDWGSVVAIDLQSFAGLMSLLVIGLLSESLAFSVPRANTSSGTTSVTFIPLAACVLLFGPAISALFVTSTGIFGEVFVRRKSWSRRVFNISQFALSSAVAGLIFSFLGGVPLAAPQAGSPILSFDSQVGPFLAFGVTFLFINHLTVSLAVAISQQLSFSRGWRLVAGSSNLSILQDMLVSPIAVATAFFYLELGLVGLLITLLPLLFIRHSYQTNLRLADANRDLLRALVKAIETRDPYTSGHSLRVASLSRRIAEKMGLSIRKVDQIETAALLHDIGKIEAVYTEILMKPGDLSRDERAIIESHVTKGVELLQNISSFDSQVIDAVKYHHERVDGKGYPEGISGEAIPVGARIIKVCDAIDAMLSDRPYRRALTLVAVREQLETYAGIQFDSKVVDIVVQSTVLERHSQDLAELGRVLSQPAEIEVEEHQPVAESSTLVRSLARSRAARSVATN